MNIAGPNVIKVNSLKQDIKSYFKKEKKLTTKGNNAAY